eukprot:5614867-Lingulodinium_polyedra.AAC.1
MVSCRVLKPTTSSRMNSVGLSVAIVCNARANMMPRSRRARFVQVFPLRVWRGGPAAYAPTLGR